MNYYVGGVAAYATGVSVEGTDVDVSVATTYTKKLTIAGMFVKADTITVNDSTVDFELKENVASASERTAYVSSLNTVNGDTIINNAHNNNLVKSAGLVVFLNAENAQRSVFNKVSIASDVDFDCVFAGSILDVATSNKSNMELVKLHDVYVNSNVNVLVAYGYARQLIAATVTFTKSNAYNIILTGSTKLTKYIVTGTTEDTIVEQRYSASLFTYKDNYKYLTVDIATLRIKTTTSISEKLGSTDNLRIKNNIYGAVDY